MRRKVLVEILFICAGILFLSGTVGVAFAFSNSGDENQNPVVSGVHEVSDSIEYIGTVNTNMITSSLYNQNGIVIWQVTPNMDVNKYYLTDLKFYAMLNKNENKLSILIDSSEESKALRGMIPSLRNEENRALCSNPDPAHHCHKYSSHKTLIYDVLEEVFDELKDKLVIASSASLSSNPTYRSSFTDKIYIFGYYLTATEYNCNWHCFHNWPWGSGNDLCNYGKREGKPGCYACEYSDGTVEITFDYSISNPKHYYVYGFNCNDNGEETKYTYNGNLWLHQVNCGSKQDVKYGTTDFPEQITLYGHKTWSKNCLMTWMVIDVDSVTATGHIHGEGPTTIDRNEEPDVLTSIDLQKVTLNWPLSSTPIEEEIVTAKCGKITNWKTACTNVQLGGKFGAEMDFDNLMAGGYRFKGIVRVRSPTDEVYSGENQPRFVPSSPNNHGKFAGGNTLYVTIPEGASAGNYDMKLELWNDDTDELCDATEWKEDLFTVGGNNCPVLSDGKVEPLEGGELTNFVFSVIYKDEDGDEPVGKYVWIIGFQGTNKVYDETKEMISGSGDIKMGVTYTYSTTLPAAEYCYYFYFSDGECAAYLPEGGYPGFEGPNVDGVTAENHPPTATKIEPTSDSITIEPGDTQEFKVKAEDVDEEEHNNLKMIEWFVDDALMETASADGKSAEGSFSYTFENAGTFYVKATVYDEQMEEASVTWEVNVGEDVGLIEKEILDKDGNEIGLKVRIEYPTTLSVKESGNSELGWLDIQLKTKDFEGATFPDDETNLKSGCIYIVSDEDMYVDVDGVEFEVAPVPQKLHHEAFGWKDYKEFLGQEKKEWGMMAFERIFAGLPGYGLLPGPSLLMWLRDTVNWNPLEEIEYDIGGPIDVSFYDKNNHDTWEYPWSFYLFSIAKSKSEQRGNGVHLRIPFLYEKAGKHEIIIYLFIEDFKSYGYQPFDRVYTIGKNYKCSIYVSE